MTANGPVTLLLNAALDGELDAAGMLDLEKRIAADPALAAEYRRLAALRARVARLDRGGAPAALRSRVLAMAQAPQAAPRRGLWSAPARAAAASLLLGMFLGAGGYGLLTTASTSDQVDRDVVASFVRGRLSGQPVDVATSDRHQVKPWFAGKVPEATTVVDLKTEGFPLVGGRLDIVKGEPAATLVYQRREHSIALTELPNASGLASLKRRETRDGYTLLEWSDKSRRYIAVSDLPPAELDAFAAAFRNAAAAEREEPAKP